MSCKTVSRILLTQAAVLALCMPNPVAAQTWEQLSDGTGGPSARQNQTAVLDTPTASMIVFGGQLVGGGRSGAPVDEVWSFNIATSQWTAVSPALVNSNLARSGHTAVYDWAGSNMIIFGGSTAAGGIGGCVNDTWVLSNANGVKGTPTWVPGPGAVVPGAPPPQPAIPAPAGLTARTGHSAVYDPTTNSMIIFGGQDCSGNDLSDVWVLSNANGQGGTPTWTQLFPAGPGPSGRFYHTAVYDPGTNTMTVFGGNSGSGGSGAIANNDVWVLSDANGTGGTPTWMQLAPDTFLGQPSARYAHTAVYDQSTARMIVFGGQYGSGGSLFANDVWVLYGANGALGPTACQWAPLAPAGGMPDGRSFPTGVYDYGTNELIMYSGVTTSAALTDTWLLQDAAVPRTNNYIQGYPGSTTKFGDYDNDGKSDFATFRPALGTWFVEPSSKPLVSTNNILQGWGFVGDIPVPGDYNGDGKTDYIVFRPSMGTWFIQINGSNTQVVVPWGVWGDIPLVGDYDGDGKLDLAVFRPSTGQWFVKSSKSPNSPILKAFGAYGDIPVAGDFDGDGITDIAVWRPSADTWFILPSKKPGTTMLVGYGISGDVPVIGDFDGDGKTDIGVFRQSVNTWFIIPSSKPNTQLVHPWGLPGDVPIVGDFDGDKKSDFATWRPSDNTWFVIQSSNGQILASPYGTSGDDPALRATGPVN